MTTVKAILFDLDGTLRDTNALIYESMSHAFESLGLPSPTREELAPYIHHHSFVHRAFAPNVSLDDFEKPYGQKAEELLPTVGLFDLAADTLKDLKQAGYRLGIVTAARSAPTDVQDYGINKYLDTLVSARDITAHKPDPEGVNLALK